MRCQVSAYKSVKDAAGGKTDLLRFLTADKWRAECEAIRSEEDKERRREMKSQLPAITPSGLFTERKKSGLVKHSGFICIDIDGGDNPSVTDWQAFAEQLSHFRETAFSGLSVSGSGAFFLVPISNPESHENHYRAIEEDLLRFGIIADHACKDVTRLRIYSYNEKPYINEAAQVYTRIYKPKPINKNYFSGGDQVEKLVRKIVDAGAIIAPDYHTWFQVAGALANVRNGRELFHAISAVDCGQYNERECDRQFNAVKAGAGISINTLFYYAKLKGITLI